MIAASHSPCPCGSGSTYERCCRPLHQGSLATTPEALMRSRYSAFALHLPDYLRATWHPSTCPIELETMDGPEWTRLQVLSHMQQGDRGQVHFRAIHKAGSGWGYLEEVSDFVREQGRWLYVSGDTRQGSLKPGRNEPCPCGSGRKFKACCL